MVKCQLCSREFTQMTNSHMKSHGLTLPEYKVKFPLAEIVSQALKDKISAANKGKVRTEEHKANLKASVRKTFEDGRVAHNKGVTGVVKDSEETKAKKRAIHLGAKRSEETRQRMSVANAGRQRSEEAIDKWRLSNALAIEKNGGVGFNKGFKHSDETKDRLREIAKARGVEQYGPKLEAMWKARRGSVATPQQRLNYSKGRIEYMLANPDKINKVLFDTKPELEFAEELRKRNIPFTKQYHTSNPHCLYDFKIMDSIIVEIDGPYHYLEKMHSSPEAFQYRIEKDAIKNYVAIKKGFKIYRIKVAQHLPSDWIQILRDQGCDLF